MQDSFETNADRQVVLTGMLSEFRTALLHEIDAAKRHAASSAAALINGKRIGQISQNFQYLFNIENALNLPGDAPGDLIVPGHGSLKVVVVSVDGMVITLSVPEDLGAFVPSALLKSDLTFLMDKLIGRIEERAGNSNQVGDRILGGSVNGQPVELEQIEKGELNLKQHVAVASSIGRNTTFIWGPPGTGKTLTIGRIAEQLCRRDRSVLVVSHTNVAVDGAVREIARHIDQDALAQGEIVRVGTPKDLKLKEEIPEVLLQTHVDRRSAELANRRDALKNQLEEVIAELKRISRSIDICEWIDGAGGDIASMTSDLEVVEELETELEFLQSEISEREAWSDHWNIAEVAAQDALRHLDEIRRLDTRISKLQHQVLGSEMQLGEIADDLSKAKVVLGEVSMVGWLMRKWRGLPSPEEQETIVKNLQTKLGQAGLARDETNAMLRTYLEKRTPLSEKVEVFRRKYSSEPDEVLQQRRRYDKENEEMKQSIIELTEQHRSARVELRSLLESRVLALRHFGLVGTTHTSLHDMLDDIRNAFDRAVEETKDVTLQELRVQRDELISRIRDIESELVRIEEALKKVEQLVIADAKVVATTLTCTYLRDSIQARRFDTVILDEASMAPMPALWIAAGLEVLPVVWTRILGL